MTTSTRATVFVVDELGEIQPQIQVNLLRALQEGDVEPFGGRFVSTEFRLICATKRTWQKDARAGRFSDDRYCRISVVPIREPLFSDRLENVSPLGRGQPALPFCCKHR